ncbi:NMD protein affecting ribosome stability and mRNA decay [Candidatus Methanoperedens nitroreducens]|uniref:NMD protein affecting ribosome stability and mRNA decay n=1 Tax=Candidatus Methanoperedens nitratireducens TaxID=1392998 RepID=A0A062VCF9_9EURY|nr:60S ribosomal export protein NMD3 [Candidatus Methanoperedens nitroreducens]KCZ73369.1 NMD protein affecting ribosome stability and mRNA decay [Candidatus Methanoperedens nitroreducens]MDJ1422682.1 60S ribosomal export protein NMD3 [Candidatus Methanoperedens sp.]
MTGIFCPKCGRDVDILYGKVCRQCFIGGKKLLECPAVIHLRICPTCGSVFKRGKWSSGEDEVETILDSVKDNLKINRDATDLELTLTPNKLDYSRYKVHIEAKARIEGVEIDASQDTEIRISWETCDVCSRIAGGYFEGIIQIRADKRFPAQEEQKECIMIAEDVAARAQERGDRLAFIAKTAELREGIDIYVGLIKLGRQICRAIIDRFGGRFTESPKLVGQKDGEDLYRITFALRLPEFVGGDIINVDDTVIEVHSSGKYVSGIDLDTGKRFIEKYDSLANVKKLGRMQDAVSAVLVADEKRIIQVLDPDTYETVTVKRPEFLSAKPGDEIKIIKTAKGIYVLP